MRETPSYYLMVWRNERRDHVWTETYSDLDRACEAFDEADRIVTAGPERSTMLAAVALVLVDGQPRWAPVNMVTATEMWRRDKDQERAAMLAERRAYRDRLV